MRRFSIKATAVRVVPAGGNIEIYLLILDPAPALVVHYVHTIATPPARGGGMKLQRHKVHSARSLAMRSIAIITACFSFLSSISFLFTSQLKRKEIDNKGADNIYYVKIDLYIKCNKM